MTWTRLDDQWDMSEKLIRAADAIGSDAPHAMWVRAVTYCNRVLSDGRIHGATLRTLTKHKKPQKVIDALVESGALLRLAEDAYEIHDFLEWNEPRAEVEARRAKKASAGSKGGRRSGEVRAGKQEPPDVKRDGSRIEAPASPELPDSFAVGSALANPFSRSRSRSSSSPSPSPCTTNLGAGPPDDGGGDPSPDVAAPMPPGNPEPIGTPADIRATPRGNPPPQSAQDAPVGSPTPTATSEDPKARPGATSADGGASARVLPGFGPTATPAGVLAELRRHPQLAHVVEGARHAPATLAEHAGRTGAGPDDVAECIAYVASLTPDGESVKDTLGRLRGSIGSARRRAASQPRQPAAHTEAPPKPKLPPGTGRTPDPMPLPTRAGPVEPSSNPVLRALGVDPVPLRRPAGTSAPSASPASAGAKGGAPSAVGDLLGGFVRGPSGDA